MAIYLDILPDELIIVVASKLVNVNHLSICSFKIHQLFCKDIIYELIFGCGYPQLHTFIKGCKNVRGSPDWIDLKIVLITSDGDTPMFTDNYDSDVYYLYRISKEFPVIYNYIKDVNLGNALVYLSANWYIIYNDLKIYRDYEFIKGKFSVETHNILIRDVVITHPDSYLLLIASMITRLSCGRMSLRAIFSLFVYSSDMYNKIHGLLSFEILRVSTVEVLEEYISTRRIPRYILDIFLYNLIT